MYSVGSSAHRHESHDGNSGVISVHHAPPPAGGPWPHRTWLTTTSRVTPSTGPACSQWTGRGVRPCPTRSRPPLSGTSTRESVMFSMGRYSLDHLEAEQSSIELPRSSLWVAPEVEVFAWGPRQTTPDSGGRIGAQGLGRTLWDHLHMLTHHCTHTAQEHPTIHTTVRTQLTVAHSTEGILATMVTRVPTSALTRVTRVS